MILVVALINLQVAALAAVAATHYLLSHNSHLISLTNLPIRPRAFFSGALVTLPSPDLNMWLVTSFLNHMALTEAHIVDRF